MVKVILHVVGIDELLLQLAPLGGVGTQGEGVRQEVVGRRVLIHAAHEVADGVEEVLLLHHGGVEDDVVAQLLLSAPDVVCHSLQHLEAEAVLRRLIQLGEQVGVANGEQVVGRHADMQNAGVLRLQSALDEMQVVGVHLGLASPHGIGPSAQVADDIFHVQIAPLDDAHFDGRTALGHTLARKLQQLRLEALGIRQVGLHHDARLVVLELGQREHILEDLHRQVGVLVFFHIEIDEFGTCHAVGVCVGMIDGCLIERRDATDEFRVALLII